MKYITSKMATDVNYTFYTKGPNGINVVTDEITINGGADVINKRTLITPEGMITEISDDKLEKLKSHPVFQQHIQNGFIVVVDTEKQAEKEHKNLEEDKSKQLTEKDYEKQGKKSPKSKK